MSKAGHEITPTVLCQLLKCIEKRLKGNLPACRQGLSLHGGIVENTIFLCFAKLSPGSCNPLAISGSNRVKEKQTHQRRKEWREEVTAGCLGDTELSPLWPVQQTCRSYLLNMSRATHFPSDPSALRWASPDHPSPAGPAISSNTHQITSLFGFKTPTASTALSTEAKAPGTASGASSGRPGRCLGPRLTSGCPPAFLSILFTIIYVCRAQLGTEATANQGPRHGYAD